MDRKPVKGIYINGEEIDVSVSRGIYATEVYIDNSFRGLVIYGVAFNNGDVYNCKVYPVIMEIGPKNLPVVIGHESYEDTMLKAITTIVYEAHGISTQVDVRIDHVISL
jgi:hypothetical protein